MLFRSYFENPKCKKSWVDPGASSTSTATPNRFVRETVLFGGTRGAWYYYELLKPREPINTKCYQQQLTNLNRSLLEKWPEYRKRQRQSHFPLWQCPITYAKIGSRHVGSIQSGTSNPCGLLTRLHSFRLSRVCIDDFTHLLSSSSVRTKM